MPVELFHDLSELASAHACVLEVLARLILKLTRAQVLEYLEGNYVTLSANLTAVPALAQLQQLAAAGICTQTRLLEEMEMPGLLALLVALPPELRTQVEAAIAAEETGQVEHRTGRVTAVHPRGVSTPEQGSGWVGAVCDGWRSLPQEQLSALGVPQEPEASGPRNPWPWPGWMVQD